MEAPAPAGPANSARVAAIRTAKLDVSDALNMNDRGISWEEKESLEKTTDLSFVGYELMDS